MRAPCTLGVCGGAATARIDACCWMCLDLGVTCACSLCIAHLGRAGMRLMLRRLAREDSAIAGGAWLSVRNRIALSTFR